MRKLFTISVLCLVVASCGGGGGGDSTAGGGSGGTSGGIRANVSSLNFSMVRTESPPPTQSFTVSWSDSNVAGIAVGVPPGQSLPPWMIVSAAGTSSPVTVTVEVFDFPTLPVGTQDITLRIVSGDANANPIDTIDVPISFTITDPFRVSETDLTFDYVAGASPLPANQGVNINGDNVEWSATADQPWVTFSSMSGTTPGLLGVGVDPAAAGYGSQDATVTLTNVNNPSETLTIGVTFNLLVPAVQASRSSLSFSGINGTTFSSQAFNFSLENGQSTAWTATTSEPWIVLNESSWSGPSTVQATVDPSLATLASGTHAGEIILSTLYLGQEISQSVPVDLTLTRPTLTVEPASLAFQGGPAPDFQPQELQFSINTFVNEFPWQITATHDAGSGWLSSDVTDGSVSATSALTSISVDPSGQDEDSYTGSIDIDVTVNGDVISHSVPVNLILEPHRLVVVDNGVGLFESPGLSNLSHTVTVMENRRVDANWSATSDQPWLNVTPSGTTGDALTLTADTTGLAAETIHYASVTLTSTTPSITNSGEEVVKVGLYVTATTPADDLAIILDIVREETGLVADPIRPYVYVTDGDADIDIYNIYTGALVDTITGAGAELRTMAISSDGDTLYVQNWDNWSIVSIDLAASPYVINAPWTDPVWSNCPDCRSNGYDMGFHYTRINGREALVGGKTTIIDATTGAKRTGRSFDVFFIEPDETAVTPDGTLLFTTRRSRDPHTVFRYVLTYSEIDDEFAITETLRANKSGTNRGLSTDTRGDLVFRSCWHPLAEIEVYDGADLSTLSTISDGDYGAAMYGPDGLVYCVRYYSDSRAPGSPDVWSMNPTTREIVKSFDIGNEVDEDMHVFSGDGLRLITHSGNRFWLTFQTIP